MNITPQFLDAYKQKIIEFQENITRAVEALGETGFLRDRWDRKDGNGWGQSNIVQNGMILEKGGVNLSSLEVPLTAQMATQMSTRGKNINRNELDTYSLFATGVSLVFHAINPNIPTVHLNYRIICIKEKQTVIDCWFGGGADLTPYYLYEDDCALFHQELKNACDFLDPNFYSKYKKECDDYFYIKHRGIRRGIGGIFFDDQDSYDPEQFVQFQEKCVEAFISSYTQIVQRRINLPITEDLINWAQIRRGQYIEFNLVYDRGTMFGLKTPDANIEAILMPMPLAARWEYKYQPKPEEEEVLEVLRNPREWIQ